MSEKSISLVVLSTYLTLKSQRSPHYMQKKSNKTLKETLRRSSRLKIKYG